MSDYGSFMPSPGFANLTGSIPARYDMQNLYLGSYNPSQVHLKNNVLYRFYMRFFMAKAISVFQWKMPESWSEDYFKYVLYSWGFIAVFQTWQYGVVAQYPALEGYTMMFQPRSILIDNQWFHQLRRVIGTNCVLFKLMPDFGGLVDLVSAYAEQMACAHQDILINLQNAKVSFVFGVDDAKMAQDMKKLYDKISDGEPAVFYKKKKAVQETEKMWEVFQQNIKNNYIADTIITDMRKIENAFDTWLGIPNTNYEKKERMSTNEVNANNADTHTFSGQLLKRLQKSCDEVNRMFGSGIMSVDWNEAIKKDMGVMNNGNIDTSGNVKTTA